MPVSTKGAGVARSAGARVATVAAPGQIRLDPVERARLAAGEVRVRLEGCGVCASNIPVWQGRPWFEYPLSPGSPGHEGWGRVEEVGPRVDTVQPGDRVAVLAERAFADYVVAPGDAVVPLPAVLDGSPFPGEPLGCAMNVFRRSNICAGDTVAIVGIGFLGAVLTRLAVVQGASVIAVSRGVYARDLALAMRADEAIPLDGEGGAVSAVTDLTGGALCDVVIESTGSQAPLEVAAKLARVRGRLVIAGYHQDGARQVDMQLWNWRGLDVINAHEREQSIYVRGMREAVAAVVEGRLDPTPLYTHRFPLERLDDALNAASARPQGFLKALVMT